MILRSNLIRRPKGPCLLIKTCYVIIKTRCPYGSEANISLVMDDTGSQYLSFSSSKQARAWIRMLAGQKHFLGQIDNTPPIYSITKVGSSTFLSAYKRTGRGSPDRN